MSACFKCKAALEAGANFCESCGSEQPQIVFCEHCGAKLESGATFCDACGQQVEGTSAPRAKQAPAKIQSPAKAQAPAQAPRPAPAQKKMDGGKKVVIVTFILAALALLFWFITENL